MFGTKCPEVVLMEVNNIWRKKMYPDARLR